MKRTLNFKVIEHTIRGQNIRQRPGAVKLGYENGIRLAVKQYIPSDSRRPQPSDVTLIGAHANSFPKELYEPLWDDLYEQLRVQNRHIRSIWIADVAQQGQSGILNEDILGDDPDWFDHGRDLLQLINQFQDDISHPLIGIGHSMGGAQLAHLSLMHPALFNGLVLLDPVIQRGNPGRGFAYASTNRRDIWPSREQAAQKFLSNAFYRSWDPRVFERFVKYGLRDLPTRNHALSEATGQPSVTLATKKAQELFFYIRPSYVDERSGLARGIPEHDMHPDDIDDFPFYRPEPAQIFRELPHLKPDVLYLFGESSPLSSPEARQKKMEITGTGIGGSGGLASGRVQERVLPCGHMVPMEMVRKTAEASAEFIKSTVSAWESQSSAFQRAWEQVPQHERGDVDEQWRRHLGVSSKRPEL
ncbi:Alpha/beta hydrolase family-domain-containing protein [Penicillium citrinum]|uniref:Alpha/beta hydrolase family-domain-containing protein n=2 Tax=Penicillium TaxID=5073 RepID=A0A9W9NR31_PENCI|nr:Alpha/beta hydrolase family-domain-containing protein [Penicillium citrinum]KAJ5224456.1 Alpha/beta hydrolase family-domain-containing protein [Penicillium citrinum]KAJ5574708.1 Alpha/beta hydrolase family-domain-containing protein [Penicillium hetheringtonii]